MSSGKDITRDFTAAASALPVGELVKDEFFTLVESVGALEIMDPKMDSGCLEPGENLELEYDVSRKLSGEEIIGIMDQLLCFETAWHTGHPLAQTVFTSLYIDKLLWPEPRDLAHATFQHGVKSTETNGLIDVVLRAYCCALIKACDLVCEQVTKEQYYEEEDFSAHLFNRSLLANFHVEDILVLTEEAKVHLESRSDLSLEIRGAMKLRLQFRAKLLEALSLDWLSNPDNFREAWKSCETMIPVLSNSSGSGQPVPEAFSPKVQRKLASSTPPRPAVEMSLGTAFDHIRHMCEDAQEALSVLECGSATSMITFVLLFMSKKPQATVYIRSLLQSFIYTNGAFLGRLSHKGFIFTDLAELALGDSILLDEANEAAEAPQSGRYQIAKAMHTFADATAQSLAELMRCLCMNRSRMRRMLTHVLNEWENLQFEAEDVDSRLRQYTGETPLIDRLSAGEEIWSYPLSSWVYAYKLRQMEWIVQLGFELQVYLPDELPGMYWYLRYLADVRTQHLNRVHMFANRSLNFLKEPTQKQLARFERTFGVLDFLVSEAGAITCFAETLSHLYRALILLKLLPVPPRPYGNAMYRRSLRLKPFLAISIPPVPSEVDMTEPVEQILANLAFNEAGDSLKALALLDQAETCCTTARKEWDTLSKCPPEIAQCLSCENTWRRKTKDVLRSLIATGIAIASVKKALAQSKGGALEDITIDVSEPGYHEWWIVPKIRFR